MSISKPQPVTRLEQFSLITCLFLSIATIGFLMPFIPLFLEDSGLSRVQIGQISGIGTALAFLVQPLLGRLSDKLDARRPIMFVTAILGGCSYLFYPNAHGLWQFILLSALGSNALSYFGSACAVLVGRIAVGSGKGGSLYARYRLWGSVGYVVFSLIAGALVQKASHGQIHLGRQELSVVFLFGPFLFFAIAVASWFVPDRKVESPSAPSEPQSKPKKTALPLNMRYFLVAYFFYMFGMFGASGYLTLYLKSLGASAVWITNILSLGVVCEVIVMSQVGRLADKYGRRPVLALGFLLLPIRLLLYIPATGPVWVLVVQLMHGFNFGIIGTIGVVFANDVAQEGNRGLMQARLSASSSLATVFCPAVCGWLAQNYGFNAMFAFCAFMGVLGAIIFLLFVQETHTPSASVVAKLPMPLQPLFRFLEMPLITKSVLLSQGDKESAS